MRCVATAQRSELFRLLRAQAYLKAAGLKVSGNKDELMERVLQHAADAGA